jgi:hypothetical protein
VSSDYAGLIVHKGWYEFDFAGALGRLWTTVPLTGPGMIRKWERRFALSAEYGAKTVYAWLIGLGTRSAYAADRPGRDIVVAGWTDAIAREMKTKAPQLTAGRTLDRGYTLLEVERYLPLRDALLALSAHAREVRIAEFSGCEIVTLTGTAPVGWQAPARAGVVVSYRSPAEPGRVRALLQVQARDLLDVLAALESEGLFHTNHIYDY